MITSPSGKVYIGQTIGQSKNRFRAHGYAAKRHEGCPRLGRAIRKYGLHQLTLQVLDYNIENHKLDALEMQRIAEYDSYRKGYNASPGVLVGNGLESRIEQRKRWSEKRLDRALSMRLPAACKFLRYSAKKRLEHAHRIRSEASEIAWIKQDLQDQLDACAEIIGGDIEAPDSTPRVEKFQMAKAMQRVEKLTNMSNIEAALYLHELKRNVCKAAKHRGVDVSIERWYPNVLTKQEIKALRENGGSWPGSVPGLLASSAGENDTREYALVTGSSSGASVPKSRPSVTCSGEGTSEDRSWMIPSDSEDSKG